MQNEALYDSGTIDRTDLARPAGTRPSTRQSDNQVLKSGRVIPSIERVTHLLSHAIS